MCTSRAYAPPPPPAINMPTTQLPNIVAPTLTQAAPATPKEAPAASTTIARKGKRGLVIPLTTRG